MPPEKPKHPFIESAKNRPYMLRDVEAFTDSQGDTIQARRTMALCRCGYHMQSGIELQDEARGAGASLEQLHAVSLRGARRRAFQGSGGLDWTR